MIDTINSNLESCPVTSLPIMVKPQWRDIQLTDTYSVSFGIIGERILYSIPVGNSGTGGMEKFIIERDKVIEECSLRERKFVEIKDYGHLNGKTTRDGRQSFLSLLNEERERQEMLGFFGFRTPLFVRMSFNVARRFSKETYPIIFFSSYLEAINKAVQVLDDYDNNRDRLNDSKLFTLEELNPNLGKLKPNYTAEEIANYSQQLMDYLVSVNWDIPAGLADLATIPETHPFRALFDSVYFIKQDFDEILQERERAIDLLSEREERLRIMFENIQHPVAMIELNSGDQWTNKNWKSILAPVDNMLATPFPNMLVSDRERLMAEWPMILSGEREIKDEVYQCGAIDNTVCHLETSIRKFTIGENSFILIVARDITAALEAEKEKKRYEEILNQSEKIKAVGQLSAGIAHDFNNQLAGLSGYTALLKKKIRDEDLENAMQYIIKMEKTISRAGNLTSQLLTFARKDDSSSEAVNVCDIVDEVTSMLQHTVGSRINVISTSCEGDPIIFANPGSINNALLNLGINARDAMPDGGEIKFCTEIVNISERLLTSSSAFLEPGDYVKVTVSDTGTGINEDTKLHIFEPFFTTKGKGKGTGMGLAAVFGTVTKHDGAIEVISSAGVGTSFEVYIPLLRSENGANKNHSDITMPVLIIDDDETILEISREILQDEGIPSVCINNGNEAIEYFRKNHDSISAVILDVVMPGITGLEVQRVMQAVQPSVQIIVMSGYGQSDDVDRMISGGARKFIQKPVDYDEVVQELKQIKLSS